jgi:hypothetical protein
MDRAIARTILFVVLIVLRPVIKLLTTGFPARLTGGRNGNSFLARNNFTFKNPDFNAQNSVGG